MEQNSVEQNSVEQNSVDQNSDHISAKHDSSLIAEVGTPGGATISHVSNPILDDVVTRLAFWSKQAKWGFASVEYQSEHLRDRAMLELQNRLASVDIPVHIIPLSYKTPAYPLVSDLLSTLSTLSDGVVFLDWTPDVFSNDIPIQDSLGVLTFFRERLAEFPLRQIWWMPTSFARMVATTIPDLYSWFFVRLSLSDESSIGVETLMTEENKSDVFMVQRHRHLYFIGREDILQKIRGELIAGKVVLLTQMLADLGGIGKTQTAVQYAYMYRSQYRNVLWITADNESTIDAGCQQIMRLLNLPDVRASDLQTARFALQQWLINNRDYLLIVDNAESADQIKRILPDLFGSSLNTYQGHILITSRSRQFTSLNKVSVIRFTPMDQEDATNYFLERIYHSSYSESEKHAAASLASQLECFPLAIALAASYMVETHQDIATYLSACKDRREAFQHSAPPIRGDYHESIQIIWELNYEAVEKQSKLASEILNISAFLAPVEIPLKLIQQWANSRQKVIGEHTDITIIIDLLQRYGLVSPSIDGNSFSIHRIIQAALQNRMAQNKLWSLYLTETCKALIDTWPGIEFEHWIYLNKLLPHQVACIDQCIKYRLYTIERAQLANQLATYLASREDYARAEELFQQVFTIYETIYGREHQLTASALISLGKTYSLQAKYTEAKVSYRKALTILEKQPDFNSEVNIVFLNELARLHQYHSDYSKSEEVYRRAITMCEEVLGKNHLTIAVILYNLANLYFGGEKYREAEPLYKRAISIFERYGEQAIPDLIVSLNRLAELYENDLKYTEAEPLLMRVLELRIAQLGEDNLATATSLNRLASLYMSQRRYTEASQLSTRAHAIYNKLKEFEDGNPHDQENQPDQPSRSDGVPSTSE